METTMPKPELTECRQLHEDNVCVGTHALQYVYEVKGEVELTRNGWVFTLDPEITLYGIVLDGEFSPLETDDELERGRELGAFWPSTHVALAKALLAENAEYWEAEAKGKALEAWND